MKDEDLVYKRGILQEIPNVSFKNRWAGSRHSQSPWKQVRGRITITKWLERPKEPKLAVQRKREPEVWGGRSSVDSRWDLILALGIGELFRCDSEYTSC